MARPARPKIASWRYSGRWSAYLATRTCASSPVVGMPLSMMWGASGAYVIVSHLAQAHLPRMWRCTVNTPGT
jgi:hypothetical protein